MRIILTLIIILLTLGVGRSENKELSTEKLRLQCSSALEKRDYHKVISLARELRARSIKENNDRALGYADFYLGASEMFLGNTKSSLTYLKEARNIAEKIENDSLLGFALNCLGIYEGSVNSNYYLAQHYLLKAIECGGRVGSAYANLANIAYLQNDTSGVHYANLTYEYGNKTKDVHYTYAGLISLAEFAILRGDYDKGNEYIQKAERIADEHGYEDRARLKLLRATILTNFSKTGESTAILEEIRPIIQEKQPIYLPDLLYLAGENYNKEGKYKESNIYLQEAEEASKINSSAAALGDIYKLMADNYAAMGESQEALAYMQRAYDVSETTGKTEFQRMVNERNLTLNAIHQEQQRQLAEEKAHYTSRLSIFLGLLLVLSVVTIVIVILNQRRRNKLYRHIVQQNVAMLEEEEKFKTKLHELEATPGTVENRINTEKEEGTKPIAEDSRRIASSYSLAEDKSKQLFDALQDLMESQSLYRDPQLTRESVIKLLKTNPTYLAQVIKENSGMNYSQYINSFRIREALKVLSDKNRIEVPIKDIASEAGFNSLTTFYKLFQQATGISPTAYRRSLASIA